MTATGPVVLGVDFGTSNTVAALAVPGRPPRVLSIDGLGWLPSAVFLLEDGTLAVGRDAERRARLAPERFEANPKRRIDDGDVLLGPAVVPVVQVVAAVLRRVGEEARRQNAGRAPDVVVLTHPAEWGSARRNVLQSAARQAALGGDITLLPEPVAAAVHFASLREGEPLLGDAAALAVYDLGGGTVDCAVVTVRSGVHCVAAARGLDDVGGVDFDQALLDQLGRTASADDPAAWRELVQPGTPAARRAARALHEDVRTAKETLSRYPQADVPLPPPFSDALLSRTEFEGLIRPLVTRTVELLADTVARAGTSPQQLAGVYLVGGSSRIPLVGTTIADRLGVVPITLDQPETAVALGAAGWPEVQRRGAPATAAHGPASGPRGPVPLGPPTAALGGPPGPGAPVRFSTGPGPRTGPGSAPGWAPPPPRRRSRALVIGVAAALVVVIAATVAILVLNRSGDRATGPTTGAGASSSAPRSSASGSTSRIDPASCSADKDDRGLTACLRSFGGGLLQDADCTTDAARLKISQAEVDTFGALSIAWSACFSRDEKYLSILFHTTNATARDSLWSALGPGQLRPQTCGSYLGNGSRGSFIAGASQDDGVPAIIWEDTGLPLIALMRPPGDSSQQQVADVVADFTQRTGFSLTEQDCAGVVPSATDSTTAATTGSSTATTAGCPATPLDGNHMSPCIRERAGDAPAEKALCFTEGKQLDQLVEAGGGKAVTAAACSFLPGGLSVVAIYLQFSDTAARDASFRALIGSDARTSWQQGGRRGEVASGMSDADTARLVWTFDDAPVLVLSTAEVATGGSGTDPADLRGELTDFWRATLLPQG